MKKMHVADWEEIFRIVSENQKKLRNPFYSRRQFIADLYKQQLGREPNLDSPQSFTEKLNAFKLDKVANQSYWRYVDKYHVRDYVKGKVGEKYLIENYLYTRYLTVADLEKLPKSFVLKTTGGSGTNYIVQNKGKENLEEVANYLNWLAKLKYGYIWGEFLYNRIKPGIIAEKLIGDKAGNIPDDLKCFCFRDADGIRRKILYFERVVGDERQRIMFDDNWESVTCRMGHFEKLDIKLKKPKNSAEILHVIDKLSEDFDFVRVDLFLVGEKIYFGELTFIPTAGYMMFDDENTDKLWGSWIGKIGGDKK